MTASLPRLGLRALAGVQIVGACVLVGLVALLLVGTAPAVLGNEAFVMHTVNMQPALRPGDLVVVAPARADRLHVGDVITYRTPMNPEIVVTQRLQSIDAEDVGGRLSFQTRGDASLSPEPVTVDQGAQLGRVAYTIPLLGFLVDFSSSPSGKVLLFVVPGLLLAADSLWSRLGGGVRRLSTLRGTAAAAAAGRRGAADADPSQALLETGRRALAEGHLGLAEQVADGLLALDAHNVDGWILKAAAAGEPHAGLSVLRLALTLNPRGERLSAALHALQAAGASAAA